MASAEEKKIDREEEIQGSVRRQLEEAVAFYEENLEPDQVKATQYYKGEPFGDEQKGRSKVVSTDVRDTTRAQLPSLLRIFFGSSDRVVEFRPDGPDDEEGAQQQTDYVNHIIAEENEGFLTLLSAWKDALVRRLGIIKWWWDETYTDEVIHYAGLSEDQLTTLLADDEAEVEVTGVLEDPVVGNTYTATVIHRKIRGCAKIAAVPPDEFVYTPNARSIDTAPLVAHIREVPVDELVAMGIDRDVIEEAVGQAPSISTDDLDAARQFDGGDDRFRRYSESLAESQKPVLYAEAYVLVDADDEEEGGRSERRLFQCVGPNYVIVNGDGLGEPVDEVPFALFTPDPEPHTIVGLSNYDFAGDIQRIKSQIWRRTLDSLSEAIEPTLEVVEGEVNMQDILNPQISGVIRVRRPNMLRELKSTFVGGDTLPMLQHADEVLERRTGHNKAAAGLDADALQSTTKAAVAATLSASQQQVEMIARVFAETGMKRLMRGLLRLVVKHQDRAKVVRLRNKWVEVDPRLWNAEKDVCINVALGQGTPEDRVAMLAGILDRQISLMQTGSPLVSWVEIRNTLAMAAGIAGFRNADQFFKPWGPEEEQALQQQLAAQPAAPDPATLLAQIEQSKVAIEQSKAQATVMIDQAKIELERWKAEMQDDRERDKIAREAALKEFELELKHKAEIEDSKIQAQVQRERAALDAEVKREQARASAAAQSGGE